MSDLVFRLKQMEEFFHLDYHRIKRVSREAAEHIEKLEAALRGVIAIADRDCPEFRFARKALEGQDD